MSVSRLISYIVAIISGAVLMVIVDVGFIERLLIPDPCYYHSHDASWLFDLFYKRDAVDGGHPSATIFHLLVVAIIGGVAAWLKLKQYFNNS